MKHSNNSDQKVYKIVVVFTVKMFLRLKLLEDAEINSSFTQIILFFVANLIIH